jgi:hypothetical protein
MKPIIRTLSLVLALALPQAHAGLVSTDAAQANSDREKLKALIERPELAKQIEKLGILPKEAAARVDAMNDAEVRQLAAQLDALPAGGAISNETLLLLIVLILLLVILL